MITLHPCPKAHTLELDKAKSPTDTVSHVRKQLKKINLDILANTKRIDTGRLDIPVFISKCGADARKVMPTRKQMGKGLSPIQAEASSIMELIERFSFFTFWEELPQSVTCTWNEAKEKFKNKIIPIEHIIQAVADNISPNKAEIIFNLLPWQFFPVTDLTNMHEVWVPLNWFKKLGEFNGTSAGNTEEESILQGFCELIERHTCCIIDKNQMICPTIDQNTITDSTVLELLSKFKKENINIILKDFSLNMPIPTVAAVAWDTKTLSYSSEIVFTAGTSTTPVKAAIRAITEVAQLAGDFCTFSCYEASGLSKFEKLADIDWLLQGPQCRFSSLPDISSNDIYDELKTLISKLSELQYTAYAISTMHKELKIPTHYCFIPGLTFRERDSNQSLGLFIGRILVEECDIEDAILGLSLLEKNIPNAHFISFFQGMLALRQENYLDAHILFSKSEPLQPNEEAKGLAAFYAGYSLTLQKKWLESLPFLTRSIQYCQDIKEYINLRGVVYFKLKEYILAAKDFERVLKIDKGSIMDIANLGLCHKHLGNIKEAKHYLSTALELDPSLEFAKKYLQGL